MAPKNKLRSLFRCSGYIAEYLAGVGIASAEYYLLRHILFGYVVIFFMLINSEIIGLVKNHWGILTLMLKLKHLKDGTWGDRMCDLHSCLPKCLPSFSAFASLLSPLSVACLCLSSFSCLLLIQATSRANRIESLLSVSLPVSWSDYFSELI